MCDFSAISPKSNSSHRHRIFLGTLKLLRAQSQTLKFLNKFPTEETGSVNKIHKQSFISNLPKISPTSKFIHDQLEIHSAFDNP